MGTQTGNPSNLHLLALQELEEVKQNWICLTFSWCCLFNSVAADREEANTKRRHVGS